MGAMGELLQDVLHKHVVAAEFNPLIEQVKDYVLTLLTDRRYVFHFDDQLAVVKVCSRLFASRPELSCPRPDQLALQN
jgi:hypothetical protein